MRISFIILFVFISYSTSAQHKIDTLLGTKGIFSKLTSRTLQPNATLSFDLKLSLLSTAKKGSKKVTKVYVYLNSKEGYVGVDKSESVGNLPNPSMVGFDFLVETLSKQSFRYSNTKLAGKKIESLSSNLVNQFKNDTIRKHTTTVASSKKFWNNSILAYPYYVDVFGLQKKYVRHLYGFQYPTKGLYKSYLGTFGVGFYQIDNGTYLCVASENDLMKMEITTIEKVNLQIATRGFTLIK